MTLFARALSRLTPPAALEAKALEDIAPARDIVINWADPWDAGIGRGVYRHTYAEMYRHQHWVNTAVNKLAHSVARLPLKVYSAGEQGKRERLTAGPLYELLRAPYPRWTPGHLKEAIVKDMAIYGNALLLKIGARRPTDVPTSLASVPPVGWRITDGGAYEWSKPDGSVKEYAPWQVVHFHHYTPGAASDFAISQLEPLRLTLAIEYAAQRLGVASFENGARPGGILSTDQNLSKEVRAALREDVKRLHGGPNNAYKLAILSNGLKWESMSWDLNEAAVVEHRRLTREEVAAAFDIPPPQIGILDHATFSNIETQERMFYTGTLGPWLNLIEETLYAQLIAPAPELAGAFVEFDLNDVMKGDVAGRFTAYSQAITSGILTQNEIRRLENYPEVADPDADKLHRAMNLTPVMAAPPPATQGGQ